MRTQVYTAYQRNPSRLISQDAQSGVLGGLKIPLRLNGYTTRMPDPWPLPIPLSWFYIGPGAIVDVLAELLPVPGHIAGNMPSKGLVLNTLL
jgi:hypothetical protein